MDEHELLSRALSMEDESALEVVDESEPELPISELFRFDRYDWDVPGLKLDYVPLMLGPQGKASNRRVSEHSGVFFTIVSKRRYRRLIADGRAWYPLIEYERDKTGKPLDIIKRIVAHRNEGPRGAHHGVYLHRRITGAEGKLIVDHVNGLSLDNRDPNLYVTSRSINNYNAPARPRTAHTALQRGVSWRSRDQTMVGGIIRSEKVIIRSEEVWPLAQQHLAHRWFLQKRKELSQRSKWSNPQKKVGFPNFPPLRKLNYRVLLPDSSTVTVDEVPF